MRKIASGMFFVSLLYDVGYNYFVAPEEVSLQANELNLL